MAQTVALHSAEADGRLQLAPAGSWTAEYAHLVEPLVDAAARHAGAGEVVFDLRGLERLDTFGAWLIERMERAFGTAGARTSFVGMTDDYQALIDELRPVETKAARPPARPSGPARALALIGAAMVEMASSVVMLVNMLGNVVVVAGTLLTRPQTFRLTSTIHHLERVGWRAVPIVLLITFLIGAIIAQQGIFHFSRFGAGVFVVDMVGVLVLREIGVLIVCIMVAGRSGSAYTAELGTMKMREEIDALRTMGLDPVEVLILPRMVALLIAVPVLTFLGSMSALYGGGLVAWLYGGIAPEVFLSRLKEAISIDHFLVGLTKAPFMALVIGIVACNEGMRVQGSAQSLGSQTTASVVKAIFLVIVMDGVFAIVFATLGI